MLKTKKAVLLSGFGGQYQQKTSKELQKLARKKFTWKKFFTFLFLEFYTAKLLKQTTVWLEPRQSSESKRMCPVLSSAATAQISAERNRKRLQRRKKKNKSCSPVLEQTVALAF